MSILRALSKHTRSLSRTSTIQSKPRNGLRAFHSPFAVLSSTSPLTNPPPTSDVSLIYEKQFDDSPEPQFSSPGCQTYVVSEPDPSNTPYEVPSGAYPTSAPYQNYSPTESPAETAPRASTSTGFAHPYLTQQNVSGVNESKLHKKGGSY